MNIQLNYLLFQRIFYQLSPFLILPLIARILGPEGLGQIALAQSIFIYFNFFSSLGSASSNQNEISKYKSSLTKKYILASKLQISKSFLCIISLFLYVIFIFIFVPNSIRILSLILIFDLLINSIDTTWFYYAVKKFKLVSKLLIVTRIISILLIYALVKNKNDIYIYLLSLSLPNFLMYLILFIKFKANIKFEYLNLDFILKKIKIYFKIGLSLSGLIFIAYTDKIMLFFLTESYMNLGFYDQVNKFINLPLGFTIALSTFTISIFEKNSKSIKLISKIISINFITISTYMFLIIFFSKEMISIILGNKFINIFPYLIIYSLILPIKSLNLFLINSIMLKQGFYNKIFKYVFVALIVNIIINFLLIPKLIIYGAIIASIIAELVLFFLIINFNKNILIKLFKEFDKLIFLFLITLQFFIFFITYKFIGTNSVLNIFIIIIISSFLNIIYYFKTFKKPYVA